MVATMEEMVAAVKAHATANYEAGWDFIVECYDDGEIAEALSDWSVPVTSVDGAIKAFTKMVRWHEDARQDACCDADSGW